MASSMLPSERRWTSTRKSGMTVLGKVPKPINLPSQKLENHGLDSNVEIVPKGTLTWGSRPLLAASSTWGSSALSSPRADGSVGSPIHANGRPSSGGSGTRPSTGSSERSSELAAISWGPSSRPSSASGILPTSHMSVAANRPRSAETRPISSHLSRFAESSADSIAWGAAGTSEKVAAAASKRSAFTLSSGDFPTLGSEKSDEPKSQEGQSPKVSTPAPSGLKGTSEVLLTSGNGNPGSTLHGNFNNWNVDTHPHAGEGASNRTESWHRDNHNGQPLLDANMPARQYGSWHGPPTHPPDIVWYGGHEAGGLYRPPFGPPGSYHVDPYYPYVPAGALPNNQAFPRPEAIPPGGVHHKKGEAYRHMPPESYIAHGQSGIPVRPGVYPSPVLYDGCYGPPRPNFGNLSEQDASNVGMPGQYGVHNQHPSENPRLQPWRFHAQPDGSAPVITKQQMISGQTNETQGQYKVLLKQHGGQEEKETLEKEHTVTIWPTTQRGKQPGFSTPEPDLVNSYKQEQTTDKQHGDVAHSHQPNDFVDHNNRNSFGNSKYAGHNVMKKLDSVAVHISDQQNAITKKNASLMEKVEGLNSKARVIDVHFEGEKFPTKEKMKSNQNSSSDADHFEKVGPTNFSFASNAPISGTRNVGTSQLDTSTKVIIHESVVELKPAPHQSDELILVTGKANYSDDGGHSQSHNQKRVRNVRGRVDHHHGKLKFGSYGADEMNNTPERDSLEETNVTSGKSGFLLSMSDSHASEEVPEDQGSRLIFKSVGDPSSLKSVDHDVQHFKLKELARQRAIELLKEEEDRAAEQKAKGLAKLDELNMRTSASSKQNSRHAQPLSNNIPNKHEKTSGHDAKATSVVSETPHTGLSYGFQVKRTSNDDNIIKLGDPADLSFTQPSSTSDSSIQACISVGEQYWRSGQESTPEIITGRTVSDLQDGIISKRKQTGYRRRRNITDERNQPEKLTNYERSENTRCASMVAEDASVGLGILNSNDPPVQPSNKNNRGPKFKNKVSDIQLNSPLPSSKHLEGASENFDADGDETKPPAKLLEPVPVPEKNLDESMRCQDSIDLIVASNQARSETSKLISERASNNWKAHPHRKPVRNPHPDKANAKYQGNETVVWAPVKVVNKNESSEEVQKSSTNEVTNLPDSKNGQDMYNGAKVRRAEMERYIPKPIAKDLSLQVEFQQSSAPLPPSSSSDLTGKCELGSSSSVTGRDASSAVAKTASTSMNTEDTKQSRHGKTRPSWRQRNSGDSPSQELSALEGSLSSEPSKTAEKTSELQHSIPRDDLHAEGSNGLRDETITTFGKHHGVSRQRRQQFKEHRVDGSSYAPVHGKVLQGEVPDKREMQSPGPADSGERNPSRNENQNASSGHMRSHWQPKSQVHPHHYHLHGYKGREGQRATDKLLPSETIEKNLDDSGSAVVQRNHMIEVDDSKYQEGNRERKVMTIDRKNQEGTGERKVMKQASKDQNQFMDDSASANANSYQDHLGVPRRGQNRGHFPGEGDATFGGSQKARSPGDTRNVEQHFGRPAGYNKDGDIFQHNSRASEEAATEAHRMSSGSRNGVQGRNLSRRGGHFYGPRYGPSVRVSGAHDIGG